MRAVNAGSTEMTSSMTPCRSHVFVMTMAPSLSSIRARTSPGLPSTSDRTSARPSSTAARASFTHAGHSESVSRGQPSGGNVRSRALQERAGAHFGRGAGRSKRALYARTAGQRAFATIRRAVAHADRERYTRIGEDKKTRPRGCFLLLLCPWPGSSRSTRQAQRARCGRLLLVALVAIGVLYVGCSTTTRVDAGHVGIRVKLAGSDRGVQDMPVVTGLGRLQPAHRADRPLPDERAERRLDAVARTRARRSTSRSRSAPREGVNVNADIGLSASTSSPSLAPKLYGRFRLNDLEKLSDGYMRNTVREAFNDVASKLRRAGHLRRRQEQDARARSRRSAATSSARTASSSTS